VTKPLNLSDMSKSSVALEALCDDKTCQELTAKRQLHPTSKSACKRRAIEGEAGVLSDKIKKAENKDGEIKNLHLNTDQLTEENDFCVTRAEAMSPSSGRQGLCAAWPKEGERCNTAARRIQSSARHADQVC